MFILFLPVFCAFAYLTCAAIIYFISFKVGSVPTVTNPCNETDLKTFQSFVTAWKERNEAQMKLDQWLAVIADIDTPPMIQEYFLKKIHPATEKIKTANITLESQFITYKDCFFANNNSKLKTINIYCYGSLAFFTICMTIFCSAAIKCSQFLSMPFQPNEKFCFIKYETAMTILLIYCGPHFACLNSFMREKLISTVQEEFLF